MFWKYVFVFAVYVFAPSLALAQVNGENFDTTEIAEHPNSPAATQANTENTANTRTQEAEEQTENTASTSTQEAEEQSDRGESDKNDGGNSTSTSSKELHLLFITEIVYILLVLVGGPIYSCCIAKNKPDNAAKLKGLNLPEGSVRSILALITVGSFIIFLVLGSNMPNFDNVVSAFGTLTGAVIGFYFAHRGAAGPTNTPTGGS